MEIPQVFLDSMYILAGIYILYVIFFRKNQHKEEYEKMYSGILNSDKHKAKSQWDKD